MSIKYYKTVRNTSLKSIFCSLVLGASLSSQAAPEHSLSLGLGALSFPYLDELCEEHADVELAPPYFGKNPIVGQSTYEYAWRELQTPPLTFNLHYECTLGKHFGVGLCFGYEHQKMDLDIDVYTFAGKKAFSEGDHTFEHDSYVTTHETGELNRNLFYIMPEATFYYFKKEKVAMYGKLAAGVRFSKIEKKNADENTHGTRFRNQHLSYQASPICFEIGKGKTKCFMEYGIGHQGVAQVGVKHTFQKKVSE